VLDTAEHLGSGGDKDTDTRTTTGRAVPNMNPRTVRWVVIITVIAMVALFVSALASGR
jgi:hypothetical protein